MKGKKAITVVFLLIFIFSCRILGAQENAVSGQPSLRPPVEYKAEGLPEPFQPEEEKLSIEEGTPEIKEKLAELTIQGIVWGGSFPQAIINNKIVKKGDTIQEVQIIDITKNGLTVSFQGNEFELPSPAIGNVKGPQKKPEGGRDEE